jgi:protein SCO1/2
MQRTYRALLIMAFSVCVLWTGCHKAPERRFDLKGTVISLDKEHRQVTIAHEEIKGFMDAMTMPFNVKEDWAMEALAPGQTVEAILVVQEDRSWIEGMRISKTVSTSDPVNTVVSLKRGDEVPDFELLNQDNHRIKLSQYRGHPLLLTFIYTRCPLPEFCPRTSKNFSEIYQEMQSSLPTAKRPHLLTISFDVDYDTPAVLRDYARRCMNPVSFENWEFATGSMEEISKITAYFGLVYQKESGQIVHSMVTALIGPDGKLMHLYLRNEWKPKDILADLR